MIPLYHETRALREAVERILGDARLEPTASRRRFGRLLANAYAGIICLRRCTSADVNWLGAVSPPGLLAPACIVITPLSISRVRRLRRVRSSRLHVVWAEEVDDSLVDVIAEIAPWHDDPLRLLGHRMLAASSPHRTVVAAIERICNLSGDRSLHPPGNSVTELASSLHLSADSFRRHWRKGLPLTCGPKHLLNWGPCSSGRFDSGRRSSGMPSPNGRGSADAHWSATASNWLAARSPRRGVTRACSSAGSGNGPQASRST